jgi:hypothetical protein
VECFYRKASAASQMLELCGPVSTSYLAWVVFILIFCLRSPSCPCFTARIGI